MTIETKRNIGDTVYCLHGGKIKVCNIYGISVHIYKDSSTQNLYSVTDKEGFYLASYTEDCFFNTKEELIESL